MRKLLLSFCVIVFGAASLHAQTSYKKRQTLGVNFVLNDFKTASAIKASSLNSVLKNGGWSKFNQMNVGFGLQYLSGLSEHFDFNSNLQLTFVDYPFPGQAVSRGEAGLVELDAGVNAKLLTDKSIVNPYLSAGVGASLVKSTFGAFVPVGFGLQFNLGGQESFVFTNFQYRIPITTAVSAYHFNYSIGFAAPIGK